MALVYHLVTLSALRPPGVVHAKPVGPDRHETDQLAKQRGALTPTIALRLAIPAAQNDCGHHIRSLVALRCCNIWGQTSVSAHSRTRPTPGAASLASAL